MFYSQICAVLVLDRNSHWYWSCSQTQSAPFTIILLLGTGLVQDEVAPVLDQRIAECCSASPTRIIKVSLWFSKNEVCHSFCPF